MEAFDFQGPSRRRESRPRSGQDIPTVTAQFDSEATDRSRPRARARSKPDRRVRPLEAEAKALFADLGKALAGFTAKTAAETLDAPGHGLHAALPQSRRSSCP